MLSAEQPQPSRRAARGSPRWALLPHGRAPDRRLSTIVGEEPAPTEVEVRILLRSWQWRRIITRAHAEGFRFRRLDGSPV